MNGWVLLAAAVAGGLGAGLRYLVDALVTAAVFTGPGKPTRFPVGILVVNATGSLLLGVVTGLGAEVLGTDAAWILGVGLLGGYTTFSTVSLDSVLLARAGQSRRGWANAIATLIVCVIAAAIGLTVGGIF
ncbi:MAG: CrcB family protein [Microbacterium pygmaeum]